MTHDNFKNNIQDELITSNGLKLDPDDNYTIINHKTYFEIIIDGKLFTYCKNICVIDSEFQK